MWPLNKKKIIKIKVELGKAIKLKNLFSSHKHKNFPALDFLSFLKKRSRAVTS